MINTVLQKKKPTDPNTYGWNYEVLNENSKNKFTITIKKFNYIDKNDYIILDEIKQNYEEVPLALIGNLQKIIEDIVYKSTSSKEYRKILFTWLNNNQYETLKTVFYKYYKYKINPKIEKISKNALIKFCDTYIEKFYLRRFYLLNITNNEIDKCLLYLDITIEDLYEKLLKNPISVYVLPTEKLNKLNKIFGKKELNNNEIIKNWLYNKLDNELCEYYTHQDFSKLLNFPYNNITDEDIINDGKNIVLKCVKTFYTYILSFLKQLKRTSTSYVEPVINNKKLTIDQIRAINMVFKEDLSLIVGPAGSGKTTILIDVVKIALSQNLKICLIAFTGKAVSRLRHVVISQLTTLESVNVDTFTIDRLINLNKIKNLNYDLIIIDESSMISTELFFRFCKMWGQDPSFKLVMVGDPNQLPPIQWGHIFDDLIKSSYVPTSYLTTIFRLNQHNSKILVNCHNLITNNIWTPEWDVDFTIFKNNDININNKDLTNWIESKSKDKNFKILTFFNKDVDDINNIVSHIFYPTRSLYFDCFNHCWRIGDKLLITENNHKFDLFNGDEGTLVDVDNTNKNFIIKFDKHSNTIPISFINNQYYNPESDELSIKNLLRADCLTIHRSQGSEWDHVLIYLPFNGQNFVNKNLIYTAITRAKSSVTFFGDLSLLSNCSKQFKIHSSYFKLLL